MQAHVEARPGAYADSVTLMQVSAAARAVAGVDAALVAMATELNLGLLPGMGFGAAPAAGPNDLLIALRARDAAALAAALAAVEAGLTARPGREGTSAASRSRTVGTAIRAAGPGLALISVPGRYAFAEAMDALAAGCDVMIFSDNMPVEQEITLKETAARRGLLVMGPDCGTAIIGGIGLGFSHALPAGPVGLVAASGTGAQQVLCLLAHAGAGVSAALGVGGRDLSAAVGGRSARVALTALDNDPATELIVLLSKPPAPAVAAGLREFAAGLRTPVQFAFVAPGEPDLTAAAERALTATGVPVPVWPSWAGKPPAGRRGVLRGLCAGGPLCDEAMVIAAGRLGPVWSNIPLRPEWRISPDGLGPAPAGPAAPAPRQAGALAPRRAGAGHVMIDFGDDELTAGRAHPMIDPSLRLERFAAETASPDVAVILLDVVLGYGAHQDPAAELAPLIAAAAPLVVVSLTGGPADPQDFGQQAALLQAAGAYVFLSNAAAARFACDVIEAAP